MINEMGQLVDGALWDGLSSAKQFIAQVPKDDIALTCIEKVGVFPGQGILSSGKFMENFGMWQGFFFGLGIPFVLTAPKDWQRGMSLPKEKDKRKRAIVDYVRNFYPLSVDVIRKKDDWGIADAICLGNHARVLWNGRMDA